MSKKTLLAASADLKKTRTKNKTKPPRHGLLAKAPGVSGRWGRERQVAEPRSGLFLAGFSVPCMWAALSKCRI